MLKFCLYIDNDFKGEFDTFTAAFKWSKKHYPQRHCHVIVQYVSAI